MRASSSRFEGMFYQPRKIWHTVTSLTNRKSTQNILHEHDINNSKIIGVKLANAVNNHLINVGVPDKPQKTSISNDRSTSHCIPWLIVLRQQPQVKDTNK